MLLISDVRLFIQFHYMKIMTVSLVNLASYFAFEFQHLSNVNMGGDGLRYLVKAMRKNKCVRLLDISGMYRVYQIYRYSFLLMVVQNYYKSINLLNFRLIHP